MAQGKLFNLPGPPFLCLWMTCLSSQESLGNGALEFPRERRCYGRLSGHHLVGEPQKSGLVVFFSKKFHKEEACYNGRILDLEPEYQVPVLICYLKVTDYLKAMVLLECESQFLPCTGGSDRAGMKPHQSPGRNTGIRRGGLRCGVSAPTSVKW